MSLLLSETASVRSWCNPGEYEVCIINIPYQGNLSRVVIIRQTFQNVTKKAKKNLRFIIIPEPIPVLVRLSLP